MNFLASIQNKLEDHYGAKTGLNVLDFIRSTPNLPGLGKLLVEQENEAGDLNIALLLDRDVLESWNGSSNSDNNDHHNSFSSSNNRLFQKVASFNNSRISNHR